MFNVNISDTGPGIVEEKLYGLVHSFDNYKKSNAIKPSRGIGLGLNYCHKIAKSLSENKKDLIVQNNVKKGL